ncbi:MAG: hypothetical protein OXS30_06470 [Chloroflexota bacterium]|nr:hypothetical protein [Chloroflexota bacterium]
MQGSGAIYQRLQRVAQLPGFTVGCVALLAWILVGFALADPDLSPKATLGGAKALFVVMAVLLTLLMLYRVRLYRSRD